jgi:hypothetical protein
MLPCVRARLLRLKRTCRRVGRKPDKSKPVAYSIKPGCFEKFGVESWHRSSSTRPGKMVCNWFDKLKFAKRPSLRLRNIKETY